MIVGALAAQNLYVESLGCEVLESCPVFNTKYCQKRPLV